MRGGLVRRHTIVDGVRWHYRVGGPLDAPPLVMPHGLVISGRYLLPTARLLVRDFRIFVPDFPGFGRSEKPSGVLDVPGMADAVARFLAAEGVPHAAFLGNSLGCQVILELAAHRPELVARAVLVGPTLDASAGAWGNAWRLLVDAPRESPLLMLEHLADWARAGVPRGLRTYQAALAHPVLERAAQVRCPVMVVRGTRDPVVTISWARRIAHAIPDASLVEVEGAHALNYSEPERLVWAVRSFLNGASGTRSPVPEARQAA